MQQRSLHACSPLCGTFRLNAFVRGPEVVVVVYVRRFEIANIGCIASNVDRIAADVFDPLRSGPFANAPIAADERGQHGRGKEAGRASEVSGEKIARNARLACYIPTFLRCDRSSRMRLAPSL